VVAWKLSDRSGSPLFGKRCSDDHVFQRVNPSTRPRIHLGRSRRDVPRHAVVCLPAGSASIAIGKSSKTFPITKPFHRDMEEAVALRPCLVGQSASKSLDL